MKLRDFIQKCINEGALEASDEHLGNANIHRPDFDALMKELQTILQPEELAAWESTTEIYIKYITQSRYEQLAPHFQVWYKPFKCSGCAPPILSDKAELEDDLAVNRFASAMKNKLAAARAKGRGGWNTTNCTGDYLIHELIAHLSKGNDGAFIDIANFAMFLHERGEDTADLKQAIESMLVKT